MIYKHLNTTDSVKENIFFQAIPQNEQSDKMANNNEWQNIHTSDNSDDPIGELDELHHEYMLPISHKQSYEHEQCINNKRHNS